MTSVNPYASPQFSDPPPGVAGAFGEGGAWRSGRLLVVAPGVQLPDRCVKCNSPANGYGKRLRLAWHSPLAFLALLGGLLPYVIVAIILTKRLTIYAGVCPRHRRRRLAGILVGWLGFALGFLVCVVGASARAPAGAWAFIVGIVLILLSLVAGIVGSRIVWPRRIRDDRAWLNGVDPEYLCGFPEFPGPW